MRNQRFREGSSRELEILKKDGVVHQNRKSIVLGCFHTMIYTMKNSVKILKIVFEGRECQLPDALETSESNEKQRKSMKIFENRLKIIESTKNR